MSILNTILIGALIRLAIKQNMRKKRSLCQKTYLALSNPIKIHKALQCEFNTKSYKKFMMSCHPLANMIQINKAMK